MKPLKHRPFSYAAAKARAVANAEYFAKPYDVFTDTAGNWRCEPYNARVLYERETIRPQPGAKPAPGGEEIAP
ncbi:MAG: hypothetical protein Q7R41_20095 [Phycisphaerales bacterium]|nr:hypothetical protein [Phycisphaerales bacterium]